MPFSFYTYILECSDKTYYIGKTMDLKRRLKEHNGLLPNGAKYTKGRRPVTLCYFEKYSENSEALKREYELKQLTRKEKQELIKNYRKTNASAQIEQKEYRFRVK